MSDTRTTDRRESSDRRSPSDRRRGADDRHATIEVGPSELRLAMIVKKPSDEKPLLITRQVRWRDKSTSLLTAAGANELKSALLQLAAEERLSGIDTTVLLCKSLCVTRIATASNAAIDRQVRELEDRAQLYLSLGVGPVSIAKHYYQLDARHAHALLSVTNERTIDAIAEAAHAAGLNLKRVESSMVALCRTHRSSFAEDSEPVLLVNLGEESFALGVVVEGRLLFEYHPTGEQTAADVGSVVEKHLSRFERFCGRKQSGGSQPLRKVYLCGTDAHTTRAMASFRADQGLTVKKLDLSTTSPDWETRGNEADSSFAPVLGGAVQKLHPDWNLEGPNLLERWIRESRKHQRPILMKSAAPVAAVLLVALSMLVWNTSLGMSNRSLAKQVADSGPAQARYRKLRLDLAASAAKLNALQDLKAGTIRPDLTGIVSNVGHCLPSDVWLERLSITDGVNASFVGAGFTETGVYEFVKHLETLPGASSASLRETGVRQSASGPTTSFSMTAQMAVPGQEPNKVEAKP